MSILIACLIRRWSTSKVCSPWCWWVQFPKNSYIIVAFILEFSCFFFCLHNCCHKKQNLLKGFSCWKTINLWFVLIPQQSCITVYACGWCLKYIHYHFCISSEATFFSTNIGIHVAANRCAPILTDLLLNSHESAFTTFE